MGAIVNAATFIRTDVVYSAGRVGHNAKCPLHMVKTTDGMHRLSNNVADTLGKESKTISIVSELGDAVEGVA